MPNITWIPAWHRHWEVLQRDRRRAIWRAGNARLIVDFWHEVEKRERSWKVCWSLSLRITAGKVHKHCDKWELEDRSSSAPVSTPRAHQWDIRSEDKRENREKNKFFVISDLWSQQWGTSARDHTHLQIAPFDTISLTRQFERMCPVWNTVRFGTDYWASTKVMMMLIIIDLSFVLELDGHFTSIYISITAVQEKRKETATKKRRRWRVDAIYHHLIPLPKGQQAKERKEVYQLTMINSNKCCCWAW